MKVTLEEIEKTVRTSGDGERAKSLQRFFKTGKGEYAFGDLFLGLTVPQTRAIARQFYHAEPSVLGELIKSKYHEERLLALFILSKQYKGADPVQKSKIFSFYLDHREYVNNWDLVDTSADKIVGAHLFQDRKRALLTKLAKSQSLWDRRIAIVATFYFIRQGQFTETLRIAELLLHDSHDLIHKAVGWMLREVGKRDQRILELFLKKNCQIMPRTMLRYAIERLPEKKRKSYLLHPRAS